MNGDAVTAAACLREGTFLSRPGNAAKARSGEGKHSVIEYIHQQTIQPTDS